MKRNTPRFACTCFPHGGDRNLRGAQMPLPRPLHPGQTLPNSCTTMKSHGRFIPQAGDPATLFCSLFMVLIFLFFHSVQKTPSWPPYLSHANKSYPLVIRQLDWKLSEKQIRHSPSFSQEHKLIPCGGRVSNDYWIPVFPKPREERKLGYPQGPGGNCPNASSMDSVPFRIECHPFLKYSK